MPRMSRPRAPLVYVLAPNYQAFRNWCRENGRRSRQLVLCPEAWYAYRAQKVEGAPLGVTVAMVEGWECQREARAVWDILVAREATQYHSGVRLAALPPPLAGRPRESSATRVTDLIHAVYGTDASQCPCARCSQTRQVTADLPHLSEGESYVYCLDGPLAEQVRAMRFSHNTLVWRAARYRPLLPLGMGGTDPINPVSYVDYTYQIERMAACDLAGYVTGTHLNALTLCNTPVRVAAVADDPRVLLRFADTGPGLALRALNTLVPDWRAICRAAGVNGTLRPRWNALYTVPRGWEGTSDTAPPAPGSMEDSVAAPGDGIITQDYLRVAWPVPPGGGNSWSATNPYRNNLSQRELTPEQVEAARVAQEERATQPHRPYAARDLDWPDPDTSAQHGTVCEHVCAGEHQCEARASSAHTYTYTLPTGGVRRMPLCATCYAAEREEEEKGINDQTHTDG